MKQIIAVTALAAAFSLTPFNVSAQTKPAKRFGAPVEFSRCGSTEYEALIKQKNPQRATTAQFEQWIAPKVQFARTQRIFRENFNAQTFSTNSVVTIPVVVHVIHNGDAIGVDENIAEGQILSQITVLNQDFRKLLNTPGHNTNPVGADSEIEFCLAQRDPAGLNTPGIIRYNLDTDDGWDMEDVEVLKTQTQWDPARYLNIWILNEIYIEGGFRLAGYAQFPQNSGLEGLEDLGLAVAANTDGVVIAANCFGSSTLYPGGFYIPDRDKGRTATHEIGHFFGLRHIWGDEENCSGSDFCADTPVADGANRGCPDIGFDSCPDNDGLDMVQNYMDYTDDTCQNIFTLNQKDRMMAVLANSPRRVTLKTSDGCVPGQVFDLDGSLNIQGINPECTNTITPSLELRNSGNFTITVAEITYRIDEGTSVVYNWSGSLTTGQQTVIQLPELVVEDGQHTFNVAIVSLNNGTDQAPTNDNKSLLFTIINGYNTNEVTITIQTDDWGDETYWILMDENQNRIAGNLDMNLGSLEELNSNQLYTETVPVVNGQCYAFGIVDASGDGICCEHGEGYYRVETSNGTIIAQGGEFVFQEIRPFRIGTSLGNGDVAKGPQNIRLYPNPANDVLNIAVPQGVLLPETYTLYNSLGQMVGSGKFTSAQQQINISGFSKGAYFIKINTGSQVKTMQFIKY